jgi:hypothetical protein
MPYTNTGMTKNIANTTMSIINEARVPRMPSNPGGGTTSSGTNCITNPQHLKQAAWAETLGLVPKHQGPHPTPLS